MSKATQAAGVIVACALATLAASAPVAAQTACTSFLFDDGTLQGFTLELTQGPDLLWHTTDICRAELAGHSAPFSLYYGQDASCNYNNAVRNGANAISPPIDVSTLHDPIEFSFNYLLFVESSVSFDTVFVDFTTDGGGTWTPIVVKADLTNDNQWHFHFLDLSSQLAGSSTVQFRFRFDSVDNLVNSSTGWHVDDIQLCGTQVVEEIPTLNGVGISILAAGLALLGLIFLKRR